MDLPTCSSHTTNGYSGAMHCTAGWLIYSYYYGWTHTAHYVYLTAIKLPGHKYHTFPLRLFPWKSLMVSGEGCMILSDWWLWSLRRLCRSMMKTMIAKRRMMTADRAPMMIPMYWSSRLLFLLASSISLSPSFVFFLGDTVWAVLSTVKKVEKLFNF